MNSYLKNIYENNPTQQLPLSNNCSKLTIKTQDGAKKNPKVDDGLNKGNNKERNKCFETKVLNDL